MKYASKYLDQFAKVFRGNVSCYGVHYPKETQKEGEKAEGNYKTVKEKVDNKIYLKHLIGTQSLGIVPIDNENKVSFSVIDVDEYNVSHGSILALVKEMNLPLVGFRSKSGGIHLYCFFEKAYNASTVVSIIKRIVGLLGLKSDTEVFPKQTTLGENQAGSWINLPYFNSKNTVRYAFTEDEKPLSLEDALTKIEENTVTVARLKELINTIPLSKAPPCLQTIFVLKSLGIGNRNVFLFNCAIYLKARFGDTFSENLHKLNEQLLEPLAYIEVDRTLVSSHTKGDYSYQCSEPFLAKYCNKEECNNREFGKLSGQISNLTFEQLTQFKCSEPYYEWLISGVKMTFNNVTEIISQKRFRELTAELLYKLPEKVTAKVWESIVNRALENINVTVLDEEDEMSTFSVWLSTVEEFFSRTKAVRRSQIDDGSVWVELKEGRTYLYFKGAKLLSYLQDSGRFRDKKTIYHRKLLLQLGATTTKLAYENKIRKRVWCLDLTELQYSHNMFMTILAGDSKSDHTTSFIEKGKY